MKPPARETTHAEDGFALIEVLVSALVLAIVAAGVMALLEATTRSAASERQHSEAQAIAQEDQARLRSVRLSALNRLNETRPVTIDGTTFTVTSEGTFINNSTRQPASCTSGATSADYVRITTRVTWPSATQPVVTQSMVSPSNGSLDPNHGTLVVKAATPAPTSEPIGSLPLAGSGPGTFSGSTDSTGCANFADLPAGTYTVTPNSTTLVGKDGKYPHGVSAGVSAGGTSTLVLEYAKPASVPIEFETRLSSSEAYKPTKLDSAYLSDQTGSGSYWTPTKARQLSFTASPIFPFSDEPTIWAGSCAGNIPESSSGKVNRKFLAGENSATPIKLKVPAFEVTVTDSSGNPVKNAEVTLTDENCNDESGTAITRRYRTESAGHQAESQTSTEPEYGIPSSKYTVCAVAFLSSKYRRVRSTHWEIKSYSSVVKKTLALPSSGSETSSSTLTCP